MRAAQCHAPGCAPAVGTRSIALVGPPNSGKTTLFNRLTGLRQKVANFPGVTVEHHTGTVTTESDETVNLIDLPGIYSLSARSEDERVTVDVLEGRMPGMERPDGIILVLDATNLNRHLALAAPVIALGLPTLVVLNMADSLRAQGGQLDVLALAQQLGTPVALVSAVRGEGMEVVTRFLESGAQPPDPVHLPVLQIRECREWAVGLTRVSRYRRPLPSQWTRRLDAIFLHPLWGGVLFLLVVVAVFQTIFSVGQPLSDLLHEGLDLLGSRIFALISGGLLHSALEGAWSGVTSVLVFLPQILLLFLFIGILEDSGYLARAAVVADRSMARLGLNGKAFIPLLSAYACAVPAVMATRTIEDRRDRIATILIAPFMTCSARLPVYTLIIAAFIPDRRILGVLLGTRAAAMIGLYVVGFLAAAGTALALKSSILKSRDVPFMLELPAYRWPTLQSLGLRLYDRSKVFLTRAGTVILAMSLLLWALAHVPAHAGSNGMQNSALASIGHVIEPVIAPLGFNWKIGIGLLSSIAAREVIVSTLGTLYGINPESQANSMAEALRHDLTPAGAVALLLFFALAMQCTSTIAVVRRETNSWKWPLFQFGYMTILAYCVAFLANHLVQLFL